MLLNVTFHVAKSDGFGMLIGFAGRGILGEEGGLRL
jgi:hypothetical protein